jgi:hypothetical protein
MSTFQAAVTAPSMVLFAVGVHNLQSWLERWEYRHHVND